MQINHYMIKDDTILEVNEKALLMPFLLQQLKNMNRDNVKSLLRNKQIWINGMQVSQFNHPLQQGEQVIIRWVRQEDLPPEKFMNIVFEDEHIIVIEKKAGLLSVSDGKKNLTAYGLLSDWVRKQRPAGKVFIVHRLDQYTSGLLMFARSEKVQNLFRNDWKSFILERTYMAVVEGQVNRTRGRISSYLTENKAFVMLSSQDPAKGKLAVTHFQTIKTNVRYTLMKVNLETGKKNQIRVHMQDIGHSIAGDRKYGAKTNPIGRLCLHAAVLAFRHPVTNQELRFESDVPPEFLKLLKQ